eukprot:PRCOL_00004493-RA
MASAAGLDDESRLEDVEAVEIIFTEVTHISAQALGRCERLRELSLIENGLRVLPPVNAVARTLTRLVLSDQPLSRTVGLGQLPHLRELLITHCQLGALEGLEGCRGLQRLWVYGNAIRELDGVACLGDLRELWVQSNLISSLEPLQSLANLQVLALSGNRLRKVGQLEPLKFLPALRDLSCDDSHFPACEVCDAPGYRSAVVHHLGQVDTLDGEPISGAERQQTEDTYLASAIAFNDRIEELKAANALRRDELERLRRQNTAVAASARAMLATKLRQLEGLIAGGRAKVVDALERAAHTRARARTALDATLAELRQRHAAAAERAVMAAEADAARADEAAERMGHQARFQQDEAERLLALTASTEGRVFAHELIRDSPEGEREYDFVSSELGHALDIPPDATAPPDRDWRPLSMYRITDTAAYARFRAMGAGRGEHGCRWLWLGCGMETLHRTIQAAHAPRSSGVAESLTYFARPADAAEAQLSAVKPVASRVALRRGEIEPETTGADRPVALLLCQVWVATQQQLQAPALRRKPDEVLPLYYVQLTVGTPALENEDAFEDIARAAFLSGKRMPTPADDDAHAEMSAIEEEANRAIREYRHQLWVDYDPELAESVRCEEEKADELERVLRDLKAANLQERDAQDDLMHNCARAQLQARAASGEPERKTLRPPLGTGVPQRLRRTQSARPSGQRHGQLARDDSEPRPR